MDTTNETSIDLSSLRSGLAEPVVAPDDEGYDEARQAWALLADPRPAAVAFPTGPEELATAVRFAQANGLRVALQGTGHGASVLESLERALLVKTTRMTGLEIDPAGRRARAEAGVVWGDIVAAAGAEGLACLHGSSSDTGVIGYTLGGGIGWYSRRYGLAANSVLAVEAVTAEGELVRCDAETEPDLFWALRGGGGAFAAVTALEFSLYPVGDVYAGADPDEPVPSIGDGVLVRELTPEAVDALTDVGGPGSGSPLLSLELRQLGGAVARADEDAGALAAIDAEFVLYAVGMPMADGMAEAIGGHVERVKEAVAPWGGGRYLNFADAPSDSAESFDARAYARLREVKSRYDAGDLFCSNHPIPPAE